MYPSNVLKAYRLFQSYCKLVEECKNRRVLPEELEGYPDLYRRYEEIMRERRRYNNLVLAFFELLPPMLLYCYSHFNVIHELVEFNTRREVLLGK